MKVVLSFLLISFISFSASAQSSGINYIDGELMVLLKKDVSVNEWCESMNDKYEAEMHPKLRLAQSMNLWLIEFNPVILPTELALAQSEREESVILCQLNHTDLQVRNTPDDPNFSLQWPFHNTGSNGGSGTADIDALSAWDLTTGGLTQNGDTIVVAVIDGGFTLTHEDLVDNFFVNHNEIPSNGIDDDGNGYVDDIRGWNAYTNSGNHFNDNHGTHVAGTVGARGNNGVGVTGVSWNVKILPISGSSSVEATVVNAYGYVLDMRRLYNQTNGSKGAYVVSTNASFGVDYGDPAEYPLWCAMYDSLGYSGVLSAAATANLNINIDNAGDVPTACESDFLISVTNTTSSDVKNSGAAFGVQTIDLGAPGTNVYSTLPNGYGNLTGTSMATPHVAGTVGLMYSAVCSETLDEYSSNPSGLAALMKTKLLTEGVDVLASLNGLVVSSGRLNLYKAVSSLVDGCFSVYTESTWSVCGSCDGLIDVNVIGGNPPYAFSWSNGATTQNVSDLCAGIYNLTVVDASGDSVTRSVTVSDFGSPVISADITDVTCSGGNDAEVSLSGDAIFVWDDGSSLADRNGLSAGQYFILAIDSNTSCTTVVEVVIHEPLPIEVSSSFTMPVPISASNGTISVQVSGGTSPYIYEWDNGSVSTQVIGLSAGFHSVTITDANGCEKIEEILLGFPTAIEDFSPEQIRIYPNPASSQLFIDGLNEVNAVISITDITGRVLLSHKLEVGNKMIDLSVLSSGNYVVRILAENIGTQRLITIVK